MRLHFTSMYAYLCINEGCTEVNGMLSSQLISNVEPRHAERVPGSRTDFKIQMGADALGDARVDGQMSTDGKPVPITRVVVTKKGGEDATIVIKYKVTEDEESWSTYEAADGTKVLSSVLLLE